MTYHLAPPPSPLSPYTTLFRSFEASGRTDENLERAGATIDAAAAAVGSGTVRAGRESRLALGRARQVPANLRRQIAGGAGILKQKWNDGKATRATLWNNPGLVADYLATRGTGATAKVIGTASTKIGRASCRERQETRRSAA